MEFETERLNITTLQENHFDYFFTVRRNPLTMRFIGNGPQTEGEARITFDLLLKHQKNQGFSLCPVYEKESGKQIGFAGLIHLGLDEKSPDIEVGYWLLPPFWGKGYATELTKACINWGFQNLNTDFLVGIAHQENSASQNVLRKAGFELIGEVDYRGKKVNRYEIRAK